MLISNARDFLSVMVTDYKTVYVDIKWCILLATSLSKRACMYIYTHNIYYLYIYQILLSNAKVKWFTSWMTAMPLYYDVRPKAHTSGAVNQKTLHFGLKVWNLAYI